MRSITSPSAGNSRTTRCDGATRRAADRHGFGKSGPSGRSATPPASYTRLVVADVTPVVHALVKNIDGVVRGLLVDGLHVKAGLKVGDVDPRGVVEHCFHISDKALAVGGGVLEAILFLGRQKGLL